VGAGAGASKVIAIAPMSSVKFSIGRGAREAAAARRGAPEPRPLRHELGRLCTALLQRRPGHPGAHFGKRGSLRLSGGGSGARGRMTTDGGSGPACGRRRNGFLCFIEPVGSRLDGAAKLLLHFDHHLPDDRGGRFAGHDHADGWRRRRSVSVPAGARLGARGGSSGGRTGGTDLACAPEEGAAGRGG